jgi:lysophospholipase L1-like esterase
LLTKPADLKLTPSHKAKYTLLLLGMGLLCLLTVFSIPQSKAWLNKHGLVFTSFTDLQKSLTESRSSKKWSAKPKPKALDTALTRKLNAQIRLKVDSLKSKNNFLENNISENKVKPLDAFFQALLGLGDSTLRIWYYGDSQIEGDRISQDLRTLLQGRFGGNGQGLVPLSDIAGYRNVTLKTGPGWIRHTVFTNRKSSDFGFAGVKFFTAYQDSQFNPYAQIFISNNLRYDKLYLLYGKSNGANITVSTPSGKKSLVIPQSVLGGKVYVGKAEYGNISLTGNTAGTVLYGYMLEGSKGIQIDNCGIRGHSGDGLFLISDAMLKMQARMLNTKLCVLHYGNNAIPYIRDEKVAEYVGNELQRLFVKFKNALPGVSVLVVSGGDMGRMIDGTAQSYPYAGLLAEKIGEAANRAGCAFFDMHGLMAKDGGIVGWTQKGFAGLDGHLSPAGQMHFAKTLYQELMREYEVYQLLNQKQYP